MKSLTLAVVAIMGITGALAAFRGLPGPAVEAVPPQAGKADRVIDRESTPGGSVILPVSGDVKDTTGGEKLMARLAADCASHLHEKAKKQPDNVRLLEQAAAHYRACLSHEPTVEDGGALFADARKSLEQIDQALARLRSRETPKPAPVATPKPEQPAEKAPAAAKQDEKPAPPPVVAPQAKQNANDTSARVGPSPDGIVFRKE